MFVRSSLLALATVGSLALAGCGDDGAVEATDGNEATEAIDGTSCSYESDGREPSREVDPPAENATRTGEVPATMTTSVGEIGLTLDADAAPCTVNSFVSLAEQGYFDATPCHRLTVPPASISVLQCGDPTGSGTGGPGYTIEDELTGDESYPPATLAMARTLMPNSGGSQFFLVYGETTLAPDYTVFGTIDDAGVALLEKVAADGTATGAPDGPPATPVEVESVTIED